MHFWFTPKNLSGNVETQADLEWKGIMDAVPKYLDERIAANSVSCELPRSNAMLCGIGLRRHMFLKRAI